MSLARIALAALLGFLIATEASAQISFTPSVGSPFAAGNGPGALAVADLNGDGRPDLVVVNRNGGNVSILLATATAGAFTPVVGSPFAVGLLPVAVAVADFNGDGFLDLAVANQNSGNVSILLGSATGAFTAALGSPLATGSVGGVVARDFNGDGKIDLVVSRMSASNVAMLLGNGDGTFAAPVSYSAGVGTLESLVAGDFNNDGNLDVAAANTATNRVVVYLGDGLGAFGPATPYPVGSFPSALAAADFNGDGRLDLAVTNLLTDNISILRGNGDGTFLPQAFFAAGILPLGIAAGDFDRDGKVDLVVTASGNNRVDVLRGNGDATFSAGIPFLVGAIPFGVALGDFGADGRLDIAAANSGGASVSILLSTTLVAPLPPTAVTGVAGDAQATISFTPPTDAQSLPIIDYTVSCVSGTLPLGTPATGAGSPLVVTGLPNGIPVACSVRARNANGTGAPSLPATVTPKYATSVAVSTSASPIFVNDSVTFTAVVTSNPDGGDIFGFVRFRADGVSTGCPLQQPALVGNPTCTMSFATVGTKVITAEYLGSGIHALSAGTLAGGQVVNLHATSVAVSTSLTPATAGAAVTFTATVTGTTPTGTVTFKDGGVTICDAVGLTGGSAQCLATFATAGTRTITAEYSGDGTNAASTGTLAGGQGVNLVTSSLALGASTATPIVNASVTFSATVTGLTPTGTVIFRSGGVAITGCNPVALVAGTAQCITSFATAGAKVITADYSGDPANATSTGTLAGGVTVNQTGATVVVTTSAATVMLFSPVTYTATVTGNSPTGTVSFTDATSFGGPATALPGCTAVPMVARVAQCTMIYDATSAAVLAGLHFITASYSGDAANLPASGTRVPPQIVDRTSSTTSVVTSAASVTTGTPVTFTATVGPFLPAGAINFKDGGASIAGCNAVLLVGDPVRTASCTTSFATAGTKVITAEFSGNGVQNPSTGTLAGGQVVNLNTAAVALATSASPVVVSAPVTFTATVGATAPTGTVNFKDGGTSISGCGAVTLAAASAQCVAFFATPGTKVITADYSGDASNAAATGTLAGGQVVTAAQVTTFTGPTATGTGNATVSFTGGGSTCTFAPQGTGATQSAFFIPLTGHAKSPPTGTAPAGVDFPQGLLDFVLTGCTPGATMAFTITYPTALAGGSRYWKYGPTPGNATPHWYQLPASVSGNTATFSITDGGLGDDDLAANGTVVDQGGPGTPGVDALRQVPTLSEWAMALLALLMMTFAARRLSPYPAGRSRR